MSRKLLYKTLWVYALYSLLILVIVAPIFYFAIQKLYVQEADDTLRLHKKEFLKYTAPILHASDIPDWNKYNRNTEIIVADTRTKESIFGASYYDSLDAELEPYRVLQAPITIDDKRFVYSSKTSLVEVEDIIKNIVLLFVLIIFLLLVGLFFITKKMSSVIWKPFYTTLQGIESFELDKNNATSFSDTNVEEFSRLNNSVKNLIRKNIIIYNSQREFVENAAHELQTPLAVFQAKIENFIQQSDITKEQSRLLNGLNESVARLNRLNKNLLLLGKLDSDMYQKKQLLDLSGIIHKNLDFFTEQAAAKNIKIELDVVNDCNIEAHPLLVEMLVNNLLINAIQHNVLAGTIKIQVNNDELCIVNSSNSSELNRDKLFTRFSKINSSEKGTGLGLSIIKKIVDMNDWKIMYKYEAPLHTFSIRFW